MSYHIKWGKGWLCPAPAASLPLCQKALFCANAFEAANSDEKTEEEPGVPSMNFTSWRVRSKEKVSLLHKSADKFTSCRIKSKKRNNMKLGEFELTPCEGEELKSVLQGN